MKQKRTTIYDIAKKLKLNASTVSRALGNDSNISAVTRTLILETAKELNYKQNSVAANLSRGHNQTIGVIVPRINQNFFANIIAGIEEITCKQGYNLIICQSNESYEREVECVNTLINQHVSCIFISICADFQNDAHLRSIQSQGIPLIQFDRVVSELNTFKVVNDNKQASMEAVSHLIQEGYRRIALLEGPMNLDIFRQRKEGYLAALNKYKFPVIPELMIANAWTEELGAEGTRKLLMLKNPPDAIFASTSDFSALGVLEVATKMEIRVPRQLGICGYANESFTKITSPSITTIDQYSIKMGRTIAELYFNEVKSGQGDSLPRTVCVLPSLIIRESTQRTKV